MPTRRSALQIHLDSLLERFVSDLTAAIQNASSARVSREARAPGPVRVATRASNARNPPSALGQPGVRAGSVNAQLVAFLGASPERAFNADELARALGRSDKARSVSAALSALAGRGLVARVRDGMYAAPGRARAALKQRSVVDREDASPDRAVDTASGDSAGDAVPEVSDPQALLDALESGSTSSVPVTTTPKSEAAVPSPAPSASTGHHEPVAPPPVRGDEVAVRTRAGAYVIRRRRAPAAA